MRLAVVLGCLTLSATAQAFCGFFVGGGDSKLTNNASQVALLRKGNRTVMTMANNYQGPPENFAMVVPVPVVLQKQDVKTLAADVFDHIDALSAPRLVEYWEQDPCYVQRPMQSGMAYPSSAPSASARGGGGMGVKVEAQFVVGEYEIVILSARDSGGLDKWLRLNNYKIPEGAGEALAPYVRDQMKFFVAKVDIHKVKRDANGTVQLSPLRFSFESNELRLPVRLGLLNANGKQDLIIYVLHPTSRFEVANYPNVFIPTNLDVVDAVRQSFASFYAELFDATMAQRQGKAVVTEYAWQTSSCDPCPVPPLQASDLATLGEDAMHGTQSPASGKVMPPSPGGGYYGDFASWVLTRLHTRYSKESLSEDLIFREAKPVTGGRANYDGTSGDAGAKVADGGGNNFQGRYIIRHYWSGGVKCDHPRYNIWGGPPGGGEPSASAARGLATAPRGKVALKSVVRSPVPALQLPGQPPPRRK
ncbi:MAG: hypothetical protein JWN44_699 [Myxococcales bacterium]|nr:hypothetical protein [Myxococcales bacterium]